VRRFAVGLAIGFQFHPDVTTAMMYRWTTLAPARHVPGARPAPSISPTVRAIRGERAWLKRFLDCWLTRRPASAMAEARIVPLARGVRRIFSSGPYQIAT